MAALKSIENLQAARQLLERSLEKSRAFVHEVDKMGLRLEKITQRLPSLEAAARSITVQRRAFAASRDHADPAIGPVLAVMRVFDTARELENSLLSHQCSDIFHYLSLMKQLEQVLRFLADNCALAIKWLEGPEENTITNDRYLANVKKSLQILRELQVEAGSGRLAGGILSTAFQKLEIEFKLLVTENSAPLALASIANSKVEHTSIIDSSCLPVPTIQKLQAIVERFNSNNQLRICTSVYVDARISNAKRSLEALGLDYLGMPITKFDDVRSIESYIDQWRRHFELAVKYLYELEHRLADEVFKKIGPDVAMGCFAKIAAESGILAFLQFGKHVTESKKDCSKLLKLLDMFASLNNLRLDFNRLFGGEECTEIQNLTRDLIKRIVDGACLIFWQLPLQVEMERRSSPPADGSLPGLVSFVTKFCNQLLDDEYRPILTQVLLIHQSWKQDNYQEDIIVYQVCGIMKEIGLNLDHWSKTYEDVSLSYIFMMNNHFHFCNLKGTKLGDMMGDSWLAAHAQYTDYYAALYLWDSWGNLMALLSKMSPTSLAGEDLVKKRLKAFNEGIDERYKKQSNWIISNENLREKVCQHLVQAILPVYGSYIQNYKLLIEEDATARQYVKYSGHNLEKMLTSLFQPTLIKYEGGTENGHFLDHVKHTASAWNLDSILSSLFRQKLRKYAGSKQAHLINKIRSTVNKQSRLTLTAI